MVAVSFIGHDNLDEGANDPNDVDVLPTSLIRHEKDHRFTIIRLQLPSDLKIDDGTALVFEDLVPEWLIVPDNMEQLIKDVNGTRHRCGYRISKSLNEQKWKLDSLWNIILKRVIGCSVVLVTKLTLITLVMSLSQWMNLTLITLMCLSRWMNLH